MDVLQQLGDLHSAIGLGCRDWDNTAGIPLDVSGAIAQTCDAAAEYPAGQVTGSEICTNFVNGASAVDFWNTAIAVPARSRR